MLASSRPNPAMQFGITHKRSGNACGNSRVGVLVIMLVLLCLAGAAFYYFRTQSPGSLEPGNALSSATRELLRNLDKPVELHFYVVLDPETVAPSTRAFASRVEGLLEHFEREGVGRISVVRSASEAAAAADGIQPFNIELGKACFLGIAAVSGECRETLPRLSPRWEHALEADLGRAIERVVSTKPLPAAPAAPTAVDPSIVAEVRRILPDPATVPLDQGKQRLRAVAVQEFKEAIAEMEQLVRQAEEQFARAQALGTEAERAAAAKRLDEAQAAQAQRIKEIAARAQSRVEAFEKLKAAAAH